MNQENKLQEQILEIAGTHLGKVGGEGYKDTYDPDLLVRIPRYLNRESLKSDEKLPFSGFDVWNAYEVSSITKKGYPVMGVMKIVYSSNSYYHVESKSLKLYLNSFNMTPMGNTKEECIAMLETIVKEDLEKLLETPVVLHLFVDDIVAPTPSVSGKSFDDFRDLGNIVDVNNTDFTQPLGTLQLQPTENRLTHYLKWDGFRSNCRVTNQPDFASIYLVIREGKFTVDKEYILRYLVSHRRTNHFHEEVIEMIYTDLLDIFEPEELGVYGLFSRRGGIDINPLRVSSTDLIPLLLTDPFILHRKTLKQ